MIRQLNFFDDLNELINTFGTDPKKLVRTQDPDTSHAAAEKVDTSKLEQIVYEVICSFGESGCISDEVLEMLPGYRYSSITARYKGLLEKGFIEDTGERRTASSNRQQRVMRVKK